MILGNNKLGDMDPDQILNCAEDHETIPSGGDSGAALDSEGMLTQVATVIDIKADMRPEVTIPFEERELF